MGSSLLSPAETRIMTALAQGATLKVHRTLDGDKNYALYRLSGLEQEAIDPKNVDSLVKKRLIVSNMKFPAATFLLTERGVAVIEGLTGLRVQGLPAYE